VEERLVEIEKRISASVRSRFALMVY